MKTRIALMLFGVSLAANMAWAMWPLDWRMIPAMLAGWYLADLLSGTVHMYMDYRPCAAGAGLKDIFFYEGSRDSAEYHALRDTVLARVGAFEKIVFDFKTHHPRPEALGRRGLERQVTSTIVALTLPVSLLLNGARLAWPVPSWIMAGLVMFLLAGTFAQYFHGALHREDNPWLIRAMQRVGLLMTPTAHRLHHATLARDFATISGWSNPVLNWVFHALRRRGKLLDAGLEPSS